MLEGEGLGRIRPGAAADIMAMPGSPLSDISATEHIDFVMSRGEVIRHPDAGRD